MGQVHERGTSAFECVAVRAVRCRALPCVAVRCSALRCVAVRCSALQCNGTSAALYCSALQCALVHSRCLVHCIQGVWCIPFKVSSALQLALAMCSNPLRSALVHSRCTTVCCSIMQRIAARCCVLPRVAVCCSARPAMGQVRERRTELHLRKTWRALSLSLSECVFPPVRTEALAKILKSQLCCHFTQRI